MKKSYVLFLILLSTTIVFGQKKPVKKDIPDSLTVTVNRKDLITNYQKQLTDIETQKQFLQSMINIYLLDDRDSVRVINPKYQQR